MWLLRVSSYETKYVKRVHEDELVKIDEAFLYVSSLVTMLVGTFFVYV